MYWRQQIGYGRAEALLEAKWPERYNALGHTTWTGRLYGRGLTLPLGVRRHVYAGVMGGAPFQSLYERNAGSISALPLMPEWFLLVATLGFLSLLGFVWQPMRWALVPLAAAAAAPFAQAALSATHATYPDRRPPSPLARIRRWMLTALLHLLQPVARLRGRYVHGLTLLRRRGESTPIFPRPRIFAVWTERWAAPESRPHAYAGLLRAAGHVVVDGGAFDRWDVEVPGGFFGGARALMAVEDHGGGAQNIRLRAWPKLYRSGVVALALLGGACALAARDEAWLAAVILGALACAALLRGLRESAFSLGACVKAAERFRESV
jgi:hypothetical protein